MRLGAQHDVFQRAQGVDQHKVLVHHADAAADGVIRMGDAHGAPKHVNAATVSRMQAIQYRHERALAGAVLANQAVQRALGHREVDVDIGQHVAKTLMDARHAQSRRACGRQKRRVALGVYSLQALSAM